MNWLSKIRLWEVAFAAFLGFIAWSVSQIEKSLTPVLTNTNNMVLDITRPCIPIKGQVLTVMNAKNCGTLAQMSILMNTMRGTVGQLEVGLEKNNRAADDLHNTQLAIVGAVNKLGNAGQSLGETATDVGTLAKSLNTTVVTLNSPENGLPSVIKSTNQTISDTDQSVNDLRSYLKSKSLQQITSDIQTTIHHTAGMSESGDKILADAQWKEHELLHPTPAKGFKAGVGATIMWLHKLEPPIF